MACLLRAPVAGPGVVSLTTQERDRVVRKDPKIAALLRDLRQKWLIGLHHNWHDHAFRYDPLYDFSMAGEGDLIEETGLPVPLVPLDACNFAPGCFAPAPKAEKFWDLLYVARAVFFKRIPEFLACIRTLYDDGERLRVLFLCPVPPEVQTGKDDTVLDVRALYESMFSLEEQERFTLIATDLRYPFPFDMQTLAFFYRSSRVFAHFASDERRCRVASYAWASGMPVVAMAPVASLLPASLRKPPYFFEATSFSDFPDLIIRAREASAGTVDTAAQDCFRISQSIAKLDTALAGLGATRSLPYAVGQLSSASLDIRLGRHHMQGAAGNSLGMELADFLRYLVSASGEELIARVSTADPERSIAEDLAHRVRPEAGEQKSVWSRLRRKLTAP